MSGSYIRLYTKDQMRLGDVFKIKIISNYPLCIQEITDLDIENLFYPGI